MLPPQEHKRQTEKVFGSAESYAKIHRNVHITSEYQTRVNTEFKPFILQINKTDFLKLN